MTEQNQNFKKIKKAMSLYYDCLFSSARHRVRAKFIENIAAPVTDAETTGNPCQV